MNTQYQPARSSDRTQQQQLLGAIGNIEKRLKAASEKSQITADPSFKKLEYALGEKLKVARKNIEAFNEKHSELDARQSSEAAQIAQREAQAAARDFEIKLAAFAESAATLTSKAAILSDTLKITDSGLWPSRLCVSNTVRGRVIGVLGSVGCKLEGFGSSAKPSESLVNKFEKGIQ